MNADPSHGQATVNDCDFLAHFRRANRALLSRRTASDNYQIVFVNLHKCGNLLSDVPFLGPDIENTFLPDCLAAARN